MKTRVVIHFIAVEPIQRWIEMIAASDPLRSQVARASLAAVFDELVRTEGRPYGAELTESYVPPFGFWHFQAGPLWILYVLRDIPTPLGWLTGVKSREVVVVGVLGHRPRPDELGSVDG